MSSNYNSFGCFINSDQNNFFTNLSKTTGKNYSVAECEEAAKTYNSVAFGITAHNSDQGICWLSNPNSSNLQQVYDSMKEGLVFNGCENGIGDISNNSISVYISDKALSFFDDMKVNQTISYSREQYIDQLAKLNDLFSAQLQKYKQNADKEFKPYSNNNLTTIFNSNNANEFNTTRQSYIQLFKNLQNDNNNLESEVNKLNEEIQNVDHIRAAARKKLQEILGSDNAALGNVTDIDFRVNSVIIENILLVFVTFLLIVIYANQKK